MQVEFLLLLGLGFGWEVKIFFVLAPCIVVNKNEFPDHNKYSNLDVSLVQWFFNLSYFEDFN
jgi:hypothetical protein